MPAIMAIRAEGAVRLDPSLMAMVVSRFEEGKVVILSKTDEVEAHVIPAQPA